MILASGKNPCPRNNSATLAFHQRLAQKEEDGDNGDTPIWISVEKTEQRYQAKLQVVLPRPTKNVTITILGPARESKPEAILDGVELGKAFVADGEIRSRREAVSLERKHWTPKDIERADEADLEQFIISGSTKQVSTPPQRPIPPGEGWSRHDDLMLVNVQSQIFFAQEGRHAGKYLRRLGSGFETCETPHAPQAFPIALRAANASRVHRGARLDRAVMLPDITKISRLALKFPLSFVDLPACAYALFQGLRNAESAQWCAENFHKKLLPLLAEQIHTYQEKELQEVLRKTLEALDADLMRSPHAFSGVSAVVALVLGNRLTVAGVGQVSAVLLPSKGEPMTILNCAGSATCAAERSRIQDAGGVLKDGMIFGEMQDLDDAERILSCKNAYDVLQIAPGGPSDEKQIRTSYRKLALRVHPDKQVPSASGEAFKAAFARLESAKEKLELLISEDTNACRELGVILRSDVHSRVGAGGLLGVDHAATLDTEQVAREAEKASKVLMKKVEKIQRVSLEYYNKASSVCHEAVETMRRGCTQEALPRQEALVREGLPSTRAMGARDLREPFPIVLMEPETASHTLSANGEQRLGLLCGPTAASANEKLEKSVSQLKRQPKATALRWCLDAGVTTANTTAVCICVETAPSANKNGSSMEPPVKKAKTGSSRTSGVSMQDGAVRVRHILFRHQQLKQPDPAARREGALKTAMEAEEVALSTLDKLLANPNQFPRLCRELSDCQSGSQPGQLSGDLGWLSKGQQEQVFEDAVFALKAGELGDLVVTSRGVHVVQRLA